MVIHFRTAIGTIQQSRKWIGFTDCIRPAGSLSQPLHLIPHFFRNDCFLCILENNPVLFWCLFLPSYPCRTLYKSGNLRYVPYTPAWKEYHSPLPHATHKGLQYYCWNGRFQVPAWQDNRTDVRFIPLTVFLQSHRSFLQRHPYILRTTSAASSSITHWFLSSSLFPVTVNSIIGGVFSLHSPCTKHRSHFSPAGVTNIPLIHDV